MIYEIDLTGICGPKEFHRKVREVLPIPEWYGNNLDALHDVLTEQSDWVVWFRHAKDLREARPRYAGALERLCRECGAELSD